MNMTSRSFGGGSVRFPPFWVREVPDFGHFAYPERRCQSSFCIRTMSIQRLNLRPTSTSTPTSRNPQEA